MTEQETQLLQGTAWQWHITLEVTEYDTIG